MKLKKSIKDDFFVQVSLEHFPGTFKVSSSNYYQEQNVKSKNVERKDLKEWKIYEKVVFSFNQIFWKTSPK